MNFKELHQQVEPLLLCNVWDVPSAQIAEKLNFKAIGTSSSAIASMLGYNDGEEMSFLELLYIVRRIVQNVKLPLSVDIEGGYSRDPLKVANHIEQLVNCGVVGINIEDSTPGSGRKQMKSEEFVDFISAVKLTLNKKKVDIFINARTDAFLLGKENALDETLDRIEKYSNVGVDAIFVPFITDEKDIRTVVNACSLPVNVLCMPELSSFEILGELGVKRISMGGFLQKEMQNLLENQLSGIVEKGSFSGLFVE